MTAPPSPTSGDPANPALSADCDSCAALCCGAYPFASPTDFGVEKAAGEPCPHLQPALHCGMHARLRTDGFPGCANFDCFGAGQRATAAIPNADQWRSQPATAALVFPALHAYYQVNALRWHVDAALRSPLPDKLRTLLDDVHAELASLADGPADAIQPAKIEALRTEVSAYLNVASADLRAPHPGPSHPRASLTAAKLAGADLRRADLFAASLLHADLRGADLTGADLRGTDLRNADLRGAVLTDCVFLTPAQLGSAHGDASTALPAGMQRPRHWPGATDDRAT